VKGSPADGSVAASTTRILVVGYVIGSLLFGALAVPVAMEQWGRFAPVWSVAAIALLVVYPLVLVGLVRRASVLALRRAMWCAAGGYVVLLATLDLALRELFPADPGPWFLHIAIVGSAAAAIAGPPTLAWSSVLVMGLGVGVVRYAAASPDIVASAVQDGMYSLLYASVLVGLVSLIFLAARRVDAANARARDEVREISRRQVLREEQQWLRQYLHDEVLSVLVLAAREDDTLREVARARAVSTLESLRQGPDAHTSGPLSVRDFVSLLREATFDIVQGAEFHEDIRADVQIPVDVRRSLLAAMGEALRNSVRHAQGIGGPVTYRVEVRADGTSLDIAVVDDGSGFDLDDVAEDRIGISESILANVGRLPGGRARVESVPGQGTRVLLSWSGRA